MKFLHLEKISLGFRRSKYYELRDTLNINLTFKANKERKK